MFQDNRRIKLVTLGTMCFTLFMIMLDSTVVNLALKTIQDKLAASLSELQWIVDAYVLFIASLLLTGGTLGDMFGRRKAFMGGLGLFALGSMACALSPSIDWLIAARCLQGIGAAVMMPSTLSILTNTFPDPKERAQAIGMWAGVSGLALAVGPLIGGVMVQHLGWQSIFWINVPVGALALVCAALFVPESSARDGRSLDIPGQLLAITGLASLTYALIEANSYGWTSPRILACFAVAAVALTGFFAVETRSRTPMLDLSFFRNSTFAGANLTGLIVSFAFFGIVFFLSLFFQRVQGYSPTEAGLLALPMTITVMITAVASGRIVGRIGSRLPMTIGMVITGLGLLSLTTVQYDTPYSHIWFLLIPIGLGNGLVMSPMTTAAMSTVPGRRAGMASATLNTVRQVGSVFGIAVLGNIVTRSFVDHIPGALAGLHLPAPAVAAIKVAAKQGQESAPAKAPPGIDLTAVSNAVSNAFTQAFHTGLWVSGLLLLAGAPLAFAMIRMKSPHEASKKARAKAREAAAGEAAAAATPVDVAPIEAAASVEGGRPAVQE